MVTGIYYPEISGAANQCRQLIDTLKGRADFLVLTTARDPNLPPKGRVDGIDVTRILLGKGLYCYCKAILKFISFFLSRRKDFQIVHLHGFSLKSVFITFLSKVFGKKVIIKMTSVGHDDPESMRQRGYLLNYFFSRADVYVGITPHIQGLYDQSRLPFNRLKLIPNGVDTKRFHPVKAEEKTELRDQLRLCGKMKLILFVGHFSREKCPDILLRTWIETIVKTFPETGIVFIGSTNPDHYEVDAELVSDIQQLAQPYINKHIFFIERTHEIEKYYKVSDMFILPSLREGLPNSLLEAMACGLPVIVSRLEGVTDWVVTNGKNGLIVEPEIKYDLGEAIKMILVDGVLVETLGQEAKKTINKRFTLNTITEQYFELYRGLIPLA